MAQITMTLQDRSAYLKGLVLLVRKDFKVEAAEAELVTKIGCILGFHRGFAAETVDEVLRNRHIVDEPPVFSNVDVAACFLFDGLTVGSCDNELHPREFLWLRSVATANALDFDSLAEDWYALRATRGEVPLLAERLSLEGGGPSGYPDQG